MRVLDEDVIRRSPLVEATRTDFRRQPRIEELERTSKTETHDDEPVLWFRQRRMHDGEGSSERDDGAKETKRERARKGKSFLLDPL